MANITPKRNGEFLKIVFDLLSEKPEGLQPKAVLAAIAQRIALTEFEMGSYPSDPANRPRYEKIVRFATIPTVKAGWLVKDKGRWFLTSEGLNALAQYKDSEELYRSAVAIYKKWATNRDLPEEDDEELEEPSASSALIVLEEAEEQAWQQVQDFLLGMDPYEFQNLVGDLLSAMKYHVYWIAPPGPDKGIDLIAFSDPLGTQSPRIMVQVKHKTSQTVSSKDLREFLAVLGPDRVGIFVSSSGFTRDAEEAARIQENKMVTLIDLGKFVDLWVKNFQNLSPDAQKRFPLQPVYFLALS